jgi:hypothetical protein
MVIEPGYDTAGLTSWEVLCRGAARLMRQGKFGGKAWVGPEKFQILQHQLVALRDPSLRGEWDGSRYYMRVAICGRELVINMREGMPEEQWELSETAEREKL